MRHKHADVLNAIAEGKDVQYKESWQECWTDADLIHLENIKDPFTFPSLDWRIKPEPKPDVVMYVIASVDEVNMGRRSIDADDLFSVLTDMKTEDDNLKLIFCGDTGELKSAEVLK